MVTGVGIQKLVAIIGVAIRGLKGESQPASRAIGSQIIELANLRVLSPEDQFILGVMKPDLIIQSSILALEANDDPAIFGHDQIVICSELYGIESEIGAETAFSIADLKPSVFSPSRSPAILADPAAFGVIEPYDRYGVIAHIAPIG